MWVLTLEEVASAMGGRILGTPVVPTVSGVSTDTRKSVVGTLFFAIQGERFDGHAYVAPALENGAVAAVVSNLAGIDPSYQASGRLIHVNDTVDALNRLAGWYRRQIAATVIAVVGSNGKTTTKDFLGALLGTRRQGCWAQGSFNNSIGVPLTVLSVKPADEFVVLEIGTNHPGEVLALGRMVRPDMAVITSIGEEHLEFFGNVENVAAEEFSLLNTLKEHAFLAISEQAAQFAPPRSTARYTMLTYGFGDAADLRVGDVRNESRGHRFKINGKFDYFLPVLGSHNIVNALGAIAIGTRLRLSHEEMAEAMLHFRLPPMRMERTDGDHLTIINDAYNANPSSMRMAFEVMSRLPDPGRQVFILGDMRELGEQAAACHLAIGREAGRSTAQLIIAVGAYARTLADGAISTAGLSKRIYTFPTPEAVVEKINSLIECGDIVLLKASRGMRLEQLVEPLKQAIKNPPPQAACKATPPLRR